jgi:hypothetical protein
MRFAGFRNAGIITREQQGHMHTYRYNPLFRHWVLLGNPVPRDVDLQAAHLLHSGGDALFMAAVNPVQPFIMDAPAHHRTGHTLHREEAPVGEYEFLLYTGDKELGEWGIDEWEGWLRLLGRRILHVHENPALHHLHIAFHTAYEETTGSKYRRVGDVIATSHPIAGAAPLLDHDLIEKLKKHERGYILHDGPDGFMYAPSAPLFEKEVWYVPTVRGGGMEASSPVVRMHTAEALALLMRGLTHEWPSEHFVIEVYSPIGRVDPDATWWIRVYQEARRVPATLTVLPLPEQFVRDLAYLLGPGQAN